MRELTPKQKKFVELYNGNATQAAIAAGYSPKRADAIGYDLLRKTEISEAIRQREESESRERIADRQQRQFFWTSIMRGEEQEMKDRLRASELLGKSEGDFLERTELTGKDGGAVRVEAVPVDLSRLTGEELRVLAELAEKIMPDALPD